EKEGERVKQRRTLRNGDIAVGDPREEPADLDLERGLLVGLAAEGVEDPLAVVNPARGQSIRSAGIERLYRERDLPVPSEDDHADLAKPVGPLDRIEDRPDGCLDAARLAEARRELSDFPLEPRHSIAIVLAETVLERLAQEHGLLCLLA